MDRVVLIDGLEVDEPFPFAWYAAIASARAAFGPVSVVASRLPYGYWWDRLRGRVRLVGEGELPAGAERLPLDVVWLADATAVRVGEPVSTTRSRCIAGS